MTSTETLSLSWNDFQENISSYLSSLRDDIHLSDVTLVGDDGHHIEAHKVLLSASSPFFRSIFQSHKHAKPLIYLKGFNSKELHSILDFIYHGEAKVQQDDLDSFLARSNELQLKGLTGVSEKEVDNKNLAPTKTTTSSDIKQDNSVYLVEESSNSHSLRSLFKADEYPCNQLKTEIADDNPTKYVAFNGGSSEEIKQTLHSKITQNGSVYTCTVCGKSKDKTITRQAKYEIERHVGSKHLVGVTYNCSKCDKQFKSENALRCHNYNTHK